MELHYNYIDIIFNGTHADKGNWKLKEDQFRKRDLLCSFLPPKWSPALRIFNSKPGAVEDDVDVNDYHLSNTYTHTDGGLK